jgi:hypothetical protein
MLLVLAAPAAAAKPLVNRFDETFNDVVCGIPVTTHIVGTQKLHVKYSVTDPSQANWIFFGFVQNNLTITWTNAAGRTLIEQERTTIKDLEIVDHGDGTWTFTYVINGMPEKLIAEGGVVAKDVGRIVFQDTVYLGDLNTDVDDQFLAGQILRINGPHPEADSDFALFCQVFTEVLG